MHPLIELPKTAWINAGNNDFLRIENHKVVEPYSLLEWLVCTLRWRDGYNVISQMMARGFRLDAVIDQCIKDVMDPAKFAEVLCYEYHEANRAGKVQDLVSSKLGRAMEAHVIKKLKDCKTWDILLRTLYAGSEFRADLQRRLYEAIE